MKSKAPLALMEQMVMLLVFALAAALCLQAFVQSDEISRKSETRDKAMVLCQSVAETIRNEGGGAEEAITAAMEKLGANRAGGILYNEDWTLATGEVSGGGTMFRLGDGKARYEVRAYSVETDVPGLAKAGVSFFDVDIGYDGINYTELCRIEVAWQKEVTAYG